MTDISKWQNQLHDILDKHTKFYFPKHHFKEVYEYSLFPAGKLFRPLIAISTYLDHNSQTEELISQNSAIAYVCSAVEVHHTYTLMHDDLPCMDDDDERRGRQSSHIKFNEWKALLGGDGLLNMSYGLIANINHENYRLINKLFSWCLGPKGLIQGQVLDLNGEMTQNFDNIVLTHKLKTSRLIQASLISGYLCSDTDISRKKILDLARMGEQLGILFQFFDDLSELADKALASHEIDINPWLHYYNESINQTVKSYKTIQGLLDIYEWKNLNIVIGLYFDKMKNIFVKNNDIILENLKKHNQGKDLTLTPVMSLFQ